MNKTLALMAAASVVAFAASANATEYTPYVAADYTYTDATFEVNGGKIALGTEYNKNFGTEIFYQRTGSDRVHSQNGTDEFSIQSYGLDAYGYLPLGCDQVVSLVGTAGIAEYKLSNDTANTDKGMGERLGLGVQYAVSENTTVRAMYRHAWIHDSVVNEVDEFTVGFRYAF